MADRDLPTDDVIFGWLADRDVQAQRIAWMPGDVSVRSYMRVFVEGGTSRILAYYPSVLRDASKRFVRTTELLASIGVRTPHIVVANPDAGWILLEDLGERTLFDLELTWPERVPYYLDAAEMIRRIGTLEPDAVARLSPPLDAEALRRELEQTWDLFLEPQGLVGDSGRAAETRDALHALCGAIGGAHLEPCHRDFMVRNLMLSGDGQPVLIDHQDLRLGPRFYDLASLLNDSLFAPPEVENAVLDQSLGTSAERLAYHRATLQRTLKAIGTFVAFHRRGNPRHVPLIEPTLTCAAKVLPEVPETRDLAAHLVPVWRAWRRDDLLD